MRVWTVTGSILFLDMADFRNVFAKAKHIVVISGAGVSAESGVPTFRGAGGYLCFPGSLFKTRCTSCGVVAANHRSPICPALAGKGYVHPSMQLGLVVFLRLSVSITPVSGRETYKSTTTWYVLAMRRRSAVRWSPPQPLGPSEPSQREKRSPADLASRPPGCGEVRGHCEQARARRPFAEPLFCPQSFQALPVKLCPGGGAQGLRTWGSGSSGARLRTTAPSAAPNPGPSSPEWRGAAAAGGRRGERAATAPARPSRRCPPPGLSAAPQPGARPGEAPPPATWLSGRAGGQRDARRRGRRRLPRADSVGPGAPPLAPPRTRLPRRSRSRVTLGRRAAPAASGSEVGGATMVQLRPRASRAPPSAMEDEAPAGSGEGGAEADEAEAGRGPSLAQAGGGAAAEPRDGGADGGAEDEDEAPEELTFASARAEARAEAAWARETARREKSLLKEKRRRREELFVEQKKRKLLPEAVLQKLAAAPQARVKTPANVKEVDLQKQNEEVEKREPKKTKVQKVQSAGLNKSYVAVRLKDEDLRDCRQLAAKAFIQNSLYGPGTNRMNVNKFLSLENKRLPVKKAAVQFLNPAWATQKKQNAKRFAKRWIVRKRNAKK